MIHRLLAVSSHQKSFSRVPHTHTHKKRESLFSQQ
jgi:hypothetical protein